MPTRSSACVSNGIETDSSLSGWRPSGEPFKITGSPHLCQSPPNRTHTVQAFETRERLLRGGHRGPGGVTHVGLVELNRSVDRNGKVRVTSRRTPTT
jgi:hypothetical protein